VIRKFLILATGVLIGGLCFGATALIQVGKDGRAIALPIASPDVVTSTAPTPVVVTPPPVVPPTAQSSTDIGTLPAAWPNGYVYYTLPGGIKFTTPWSAGIAAEGYDFIGHESITQGYLPVAQWWKITGVFGGGINGKGEGSPMGGGIVDLATIPISTLADFHMAVTGGYNLNAKHALAVISASVQFLK
jgi:hypothetical protein